MHSLSYVSPDAASNHAKLPGEDKPLFSATPPHTSVCFEEVKEKLRNYCFHHNTEKERWLLTCHAHCFISLS